MNKLQTAYATQLDGTEGKSQWIVYSDKDEKLYELPREWDEKTVMAAIHMGRKFEVISFNEGVAFQKSMQPDTIKHLQIIVKNLEAEKKMLQSSNLMIATELDILTLKN